MPILEIAVPGTASIATHEHVVPNLIDAIDDMLDHERESVALVFLPEEPRRATIVAEVASDAAVGLILVILMMNDWRCNLSVRQRGKDLVGRIV